MHIQTISLFKTVYKKAEYAHECSNLVKILNVTKKDVENRLYEILPIENLYPKLRVKRGLINGLGSVFKAITGNLDASDGERFESLIQKLNSNQIKLQKQIVDTHSISNVLITKFNQSLNEIYHHEESLRSKLLVVETFMNKAVEERGMRITKESILELINIYQIINVKLQDVQNSITFSKLRTLHSSIIKQKDLLHELLLFKLKSNQFPVELNLDNIYIFEKLITISAYIYDNRLTFILTIPVSFKTKFLYYELIPVPKLISRQSSLFAVIIPNSKTILKSEMYFSYDPIGCEKLANTYFCATANLRQNPENEDSCEMSILNSKSNHNCKIIQLHLAEPIIYQLGNINKWIAVFPNLTRIKTECNEKQTQKLLQGAYLIKIPSGCNVETPDHILNNQNLEINDDAQTFDFEIKDAKIIKGKINLTMEHLKPYLQGFPSLDKIDALEELEFTNNWNYWNIFTYIVILIIIVFLFGKFLRCIIPILEKRKNRRIPTQENIELSNLPLAANVART